MKFAKNHAIIPSELSGHGDIAMLDSFFSRISSGHVVLSESERDLRALRDDLQDAVIQLLDFKRPYLESKKGIQWPYDAFRSCQSYFEERLKNGTTRFQKEQALLFLARLPFAGQWKYLTQAEKTLSDRSEIKNLKRSETEIIHKKIKQRAQKTYRIRRFCQILKRPKLPDEKGILRIFSLLYLFTDRQLLERLTRHYALYVEPTAGVMYRHTWLRAFSGLSSPCLFGIAGEEDTKYIRSQPGVVTTELAHADFLRDDITVCAGDEKEFDFVFIGTYDEMRRKRHQLFLKLMLHPKLMNARALVIGQGEAVNIRKFTETVTLLGLSDRVTVLSNRPRKEIPGYLARCRIGVHLALHENGCRCIYEYLRSDLPCVVSTCTAGVNFKIFNTKTGMAVTDKDLPDALCHVLDNCARYAPRRWFLAQSGSKNASQRLNLLFKALFSDWGLNWTEDIVPLGSGGANRYVNASDYERFRPEFQMLYDIFTRKARFPVRVTVD